MKGHDIYKYQNAGKEPSSDWPVYKIRILHKTVTFSLARQKLRTAQLTSELSADDDYTLKSRKREPPLRFYNEPILIPDSQKNIRRYQIGTDDSDNSSDNPSIFPKFPTVPKFVNAAKSTISTPTVAATATIVGNNVDSPFRHSQSSASGMNDTFISVVSSQASLTTADVQKDHSTQAIVSDRQLLENMRLTMQQHTTLLQHILRHIAAADNDVSGDVFRELPIRNRVELDEFCAYLANSTNRKKMVSRLFLLLTRNYPILSARFFMKI